MRSLCPTTSLHSNEDPVQPKIKVRKFKKKDQISCISIVLSPSWVGFDKGQSPNAWVPPAHSPSARPPTMTPRARALKGQHSSHTGLKGGSLIHPGMGSRLLLSTAPSPPTAGAPQPSGAPLAQPVTLLVMKPVLAPFLSSPLPGTTFQFNDFFWNPYLRVWFWGI